MKKIIFITILLYPFFLKAQIITTVTGTGVSGYSGDSGPAISAEIGYPNGCVFDANDNFYFTTVGNNRVREITPNGIISTVAGNGTAGYNGDGISATTAEINNAGGIAVDKSGNIYIADTYNNRIRKVDVVTGLISTIAGNGIAGFGGDDGPATASILYNVIDICFDLNGSLLIADVNNHRVRKIDTNSIISTIAGTGASGYNGNGGPATAAELGLVQGICVDKSGNVYFTQTDNYVVSKIDTAGIITTFAGNGTPGITGDDGPATAASLILIRLATDNTRNLYISGYNGNDVRKVDVSGIIHTITGNGINGFSGDGGPATSAEVSTIFGIAIDTCGNVYVADKDNVRIRKIALNPPCWPERVQNSTTINTISIFPNPAYNNLTITAADKINSVIIYNLIGQTVYTQQYNNEKAEVNIAALPEGMYMVEVTDGEGRRTIKKIIKQ